MICTHSFARRGANVLPPYLVTSNAAREVVSEFGSDSVTGRFRPSKKKVSVQGDDGTIITAVDGVIYIVLYVIIAVQQKEEDKYNELARRVPARLLMAGASRSCWCRRPR